LLAKLNLKSVERSAKRDPVQARRGKLVAALKDQQLVLEAMLEGEICGQGKRQSTVDADGERIDKIAQRTVRPWFFERDNGWYVQCKFGNRTLTISAKSNAVFVSRLEEVAEVLSVLQDAANSGEFDKAILLAKKSRA
jgi:hypothetical protein